MKIICIVTDRKGEIVGLGDDGKLYLSVLEDVPSVDGKRWTPGYGWTPLTTHNN
jgi:hypothetical protein